MASLLQDLNCHCNVLAVVTDDELFKQQAKRKKSRPQKMTNAERIKSYTEIKPGDYVVHVHHGIGKYIGIQTLEVNGTHKDYFIFAIAVMINYMYLSIKLI